MVTPMLNRQRAMVLLEYEHSRLPCARHGRCLLYRSGGDVLVPAAFDRDTRWPVSLIVQDFQNDGAGRTVSFCL